VQDAANYFNGSRLTIADTHGGQFGSAISLQQINWLSCANRLHCLGNFRARLRSKAIFRALSPLWVLAVQRAGHRRSSSSRSMATTLTRCARYLRRPAQCCVFACLSAGPAWAATGSHIDPTAPPFEPQFAIATRLDRAGRIVVPVYIDDHGPYRFLLDTGATHSAVSDRLVAELQLTIDTGPELIVHGVTGLVSTPACSFKTLRFGNITYPHPRLPVLGGFVLEGLDGILGMDHLINKRITADFIHDRVTVGESAGQHAGLHDLVLAAHTVSGLLLEVEGSADDTVVTAVIDTGASHTLGNPALYAALTRRSRNPAVPPTADVIDATQTMESGNVRVVSPIVLGPIRVTDTAVTFGDFQVFRFWGLQDRPALLLGMDVLGTLRELTIDYRRHEVLFRTQGITELISIF
jgi:Aspartyl protease